MSAYTNHLGVTFVGGIDYRLDTDLIWRIGSIHGEPYLVLAGFRFQVSVPRPLRWLIYPHDHRYLKAAALHDHMLQNGFSRAVAAGVFFDALKADGVDAPRRWAMFLGVVFWTMR